MGSVRSGEGNAFHVTVAHWKTQWIILASSKRERDALSNTEDYITDTGRVDSMEGKLLFHYTDYLSTATMFLSKELWGLLHLKNYCFKDSVGTDHQNFMIACPKIEVCSLRFQRIRFLEPWRKQFPIILISGYLSISLVDNFPPKHCYLVWHIYFGGYYENPGALRGVKWI